jgi:hypothetical protein
MGGVTTRIPVPFHGDGAGVAPLTWGQVGIWHTMRRTGRTMNTGGLMALPDGTGLEEMVTVLGYICGRHEALRTRLKLAGDADPRQVVSESGEAVLEVVDIEAGEDADAAAADMERRYVVTPFEYEVEWPVRMGVIRRAGALTHLVVRYCHLSVDGFGIEAIVRDLAHLDRATGRANAPVAGLTPRELSARQHGPAGQRQSEKALRYWESLLRTIPARRFDPSGDPREPRYWEVVCTSPAMHLAMRAIGARTRSEPGHVLLAAYAVALARITGRRPSVAQVVVSNRFRPGCAEAVAHLSQPTLVAIDPADDPFEEVVERAWRTTTNAYLAGYYDTYAHEALIARVARERAEDIDISCFINDRRNQRGPVPDGPDPTEEEIRAALPRTAIRFGDRRDAYDGSLYLHVDQLPDAVELSVWADTRCLSPAQLEACTRELEAVTVEAACPSLTGRQRAAAG